ncbi:ammonium transporter [Erythrobacter arachoides]|uniref:Ammonium transporter n=1 Tax=Aurantiacibacter arachoides TaxID=1850444 RepID=A0A844ZZB2_9SPHN|nr:ammonium transporter [Aurantiacibacter arachoides]MXO93058.1 ammonium transporter [Aurantiacibacter arachoides]GGD52351.1 ammonium transporter [Aurantiacibacter arachoides]
MFRKLAVAAALAFAPQAASAQGSQGATVNAAVYGGDAAWVLVCSALVVLMTLPGLGLFYGGRVRAKNVLSVLLQIGAVAALASVLWTVVGYTLAFGDSAGGWLGGGQKWMLIDLTAFRGGTTLPESTFALFQMSLAAFAPALMVGAWADRARFGWVLAFTGAWSLLVYAPVAHWIWGGGWLDGLGVRDFAGGLVVHTTAGVSALVVALLLGKRQGFPSVTPPPHAPGLTLLGAMLLWVGWFGLTGGSALTAGDDASIAIINTHVAAASAALAWLLVEKMKSGKPTTAGFAKGAVAGLVTITPAAVFVSPGAALVLGLAGALTSFWMITLIKNRWGIDDSLDVFAVHGVGGMLGTLLLAVFASEMLGGVGYVEGSMAGALVAQGIGVAVTAIYAAVVTAVLAVAISLFMPMRVSEEDELEGLDIASHSERAWQPD